MAGIYLHIPFCRRKCGYCNFFSLASLSQKPALVQSLANEARIRRHVLKGEEVTTVYFGGGTPSLLDDGELGLLMDTLYKNYQINSEAEITLEANPDDMLMEKLRSWKSLGINRLSIGVQSFHQQDLHYLDRLHNTNQAKDAPELARKAGISQMSIDLIYGIPGQNEQRWENNLFRFLEMDVDHLSAYALTLEEKTPYFLQVKKGLKSPPDDDMAFQQFKIMHKMLQDAAYEHYEISSFARNGKYARHNMAYWQGLPYLGLGPSAHSYDGKKRSWNVSSLGEYLKTAPKGMATVGEEVLSSRDIYNEYIMTSLRTIWGCRFHNLIQIGGRDNFEATSKRMQHFIGLGLAKEDDSHWWLSTEGLFHADGIASDLFMTE